MNLFEILSEKYTLPPKPKLFESFAGIGCQRMAFDRLGIDYESVGISEIDKYAVMSYANIHCGLDKEIGKLRQEIKRDILEKAKENGAKKKPKRLKRKVEEISEKSRIKIANKLAKNYGDITKINGYELPTIDVFTWSFPCQSLSKAGKQEGLQGGTRSGLVYEVLRILHELKDLHNLPKVLIMENVVDLVQTKFIREFNEIQLELESLGYSNFVETMNAKEYGVAQNRDRVFMVSILGDYYYEFPKKIKLEKRLKDYLESEVDEKYYLSEKMVDYISKGGTGNYNAKPSIDNDVAHCIVSTLTKMHRSGIDNYVSEPVILDTNYAVNREPRVYTEYCPAISTMGGGNREPKVIEKMTNKNDEDVYRERLAYEEYIRKQEEENYYKELYEKEYKESIKINEATEQGYAEAYEGDSINLAQPNSKTRRGRVGKQVSQTLTTLNQIAVVEPNIRIRKLTPLECWRLMSIDDESFHKASEVNSNSQLYKQAGNGIVVDVFAAILSQMKGNP